MQTKSKEIANILVKEDCYVSHWNEPHKWITMPDGSTIPAYLSCRRLIGRPIARETVELCLAENTSEILKETNIDLVAGLATAGITWGYAVAQNLQLPLCYVRSSCKGYGEDRLVEGNPTPESNALIVDDTFFTGEAIANGSERLKHEANIHSLGALTVASLNPDRYVGGIEVISLTSYYDICEAAQDQGLFTGAQRKAMLQYYEQPQGYDFQNNNL